MASSDSKKKVLTLMASDGEKFLVEEAVAMESQMIKYMIEDDCASDVIPLPNVSSNILAKVIEYCKKHVQSAADAADTAAADTAAAAAGESDAEAALRTWDAEFIKVDQTTLFELIMAANYLDIKGLFDLTCQTAADMIKGKTPEEIREIFNIKNDFTPEEEAEIRRKNQWAFD